MTTSDTEAPGDLNQPQGQITAFTTRFGDYLAGLDVMWGYKLDPSTSLEILTMEFTAHMYAFYDVYAAGADVSFEFDTSSCAGSTYSSANALVFEYSVVWANPDTDCTDLCFDGVMALSTWAIDCDTLGWSATATAQDVASAGSEVVFDLKPTQSTDSYGFVDKDSLDAFDAAADNVT